MDCVKTCFLLLLTIFTFFELHQCGRLGGYSDDSEIEIVTVDYWERPPLEALAYRTTGSHRHTTRRHVTTPRRTHPPTTARPRTTARRTHPPTTPRPRTTTRPPRPPTTTRYVIRTTRPPTTTRRPATTTRRPPRPPTTTRRPPTTTRWPTRPPTTTRRPHTTTRWPPRPPTTTRRLPTTTTRRKTPTLGKTNIRWNDLPPRPGSGRGPVKIKIENTYNYHYPGFYTIPVQHHHYPGYYQTQSSYRYREADTGSGILGFYLGYKLAKLSTPTYAHQSFYDGYRPRYDHYTVHHYYHNANTVPKSQNIEQKAIVGCVGDTTGVCPANTTSLCTSDGRLMCVVAAASLVSCTDSNNKTVSCTKSTISCVNNTAPECAGKNNTNVVVNIPCLSTAKVYGTIKYVNQTIVGAPDVTTHTNFLSESKTPISNNGTILLANGTLVSANGTLISNNTASINGTLLSVNGTLISNGTVSSNGTLLVANTTSTSNDTTSSNGTLLNYNPDSATWVPTTPITTTPTTSVYWKWKRSVPEPQEFCVAVVAMPARRQLTQGEEFLEDASSVFKKFVEAAWNL
ncbi:unnamed protein product [Tenebrio molitor]|nr:unnamed protein product [Tenebrio molitor]